MRIHIATMNLLALLATAGAASHAQTAWQPLSNDGKIRVIAHRGEHLHHPENTLPAFQAAIDAGADYFELDVRTTSDGKFILLHDSKLDRTTNGSGEVQKHTFNEIRSLDAGVKFSPEFASTKVPTLDEAFDLAHGKINVYVDTKDADPQQLVDTIVKHDMQDHVVIYGNPFFLYEVKKIRPTLRVMPEAMSADVCRLMVRAMQPQVLAFDASDFKDPVIACAKAANARIFVDRLGDADTPETWQKAIDLGAAGIQTNRPAELAQWLKQHNLTTH
ncbi:glycerophosphoryl diester phosphodiesterase [Bryocella elongata]|uniref:Glycerophosphoryl diester phosphodiesterase n=1 Tax=Bryocella elongata TaxID=863522 RepID=A0A1H6C1V1_9BACT|nr:glycerophosphodiester phosphodiesterase family protein [Bryocella elongata]SEG66336.1 glycerophosphoryl diester phosphodiesterase [Bryocella elongata]